MDIQESRDAGEECAFADAYARVPHRHLKTVLDQFDEAGIGYDHVDVSPPVPPALLKHLARRYPPGDRVGVNVTAERPRQCAVCWGIPNAEALGYHASRRCDCPSPVPPRKANPTSYRDELARIKAEKKHLDERLAAQRKRLVPKEPSAAFLAEWEEHVVREQKRADDILARKKATGLTVYQRSLKQAESVEHEPDTAVLMPLDWYEHIVVAFSGGKDSLACLLFLLDLGVPREKIELWHYCVDGEPGTPRFFDWPITEDYCRAVAEALGVPLLFRWRIGGFEWELMKDKQRSLGIGFEMPDGSVRQAGGKESEINTRLSFPRTTTIDFGRWCSGHLKVDVARLTLNNEPRFKDATKTLFLTGERREESKNRAKYAAVQKYGFSYPKGTEDWEKPVLAAASSAKPHGKRTIHEWKAIIDWKEPYVWDIIRRYRINPHPAYYAGFSRISCMPCIFGNDDQWATVNQLDPKLMEKIAGLEKSFRRPPSVSKKTGRMVKHPGTIGETRNVLERAARGIGYVDTALPMPEFEDAMINAQLAMKTRYLREMTIVNRWTLPRGAGRKSGGPT